MMEQAMKRKWDRAYLEQAIDEEIKLADLHLKVKGVKPVDVSIGSCVYPAPPKLNTFHNRDARTTISWPLPAWRRNIRDAGALVIELGLSILHDVDEGTVSVGVGSGRRNVTENYFDHPAIDAATMAAIVRAAIQRLTETREQC